MLLLCMQLAGLEPAPTYMDMNLNHARMPIPPQLLNNDNIHEGTIKVKPPDHLFFCFDL